MQVGAGLILCQETKIPRVQGNLASTLQSPYSANTHLNKKTVHHNEDPEPPKKEKGTVTYSHSQEGEEQGLASGFLTRSLTPFKLSHKFPEFGDR